LRRGPRERGVGDVEGIGTARRLLPVIRRRSVVIENARAGRGCSGKAVDPIAAEVLIVPEHDSRGRTADLRAPLPHCRSIRIARDTDRRRRQRGLRLVRDAELVGVELRDDELPDLRRPRVIDGRHPPGGTRVGLVADVEIRDRDVDARVSGVPRVVPFRIGGERLIGPLQPRGAGGRRRHAEVVVDHRLEQVLEAANGEEDELAQRVGDRDVPDSLNGSDAGGAPEARGQSRRNLRVACEVRRRHVAREGERPVGVADASELARRQLAA
jgi:hypothetical protein